MDKKLNDLKALLKMFCESENLVLSNALKGFWLSELMLEDYNSVKTACENIMLGKHKVYGKITLKNITEQIRGNTEQDAQLKKEKLEKKADDAYTELRRCIRSIGYMGTFKHEDKALVACVEELGGWYTITCKTIAELDSPHMKKNFIARYKQNAQADSASFSEQAIGYAEEQNSRRISNGAVNITNLKAL
jgi:hypothetical protein